jgi:hypothetical protein
VNWAEFSAGAPELAELGRTRLEEAGLSLVGSIRADGWPRISPVEPLFVDEELMLGMMWQSRKALDLLRDPRLVVHSVTSDRDGSEGDFKLYGRAVDVPEPLARGRYADVLESKIDWRPPEPYHLFRTDIESAAYVVFGTKRYGLRWKRGGPVERWTIEAG